MEFIHARKLAKYLFLLIIIFLLSVMITNPLGEFALNDDWVHTLTIYNYAMDNQFFYPSWLSSFYYIPIFYGTLLVKIFGFSFSLLRLSNLIFALACLLIFYCFLRKDKIPVLTVFLFSLLFWFNPLMFNLSFTFMGDIPTLFFILAAACLYCLGFKKEKYWLIFFASLVTLLAFFTRQIGILLLITAGFYFIVNQKFKRVNFIWILGIPGAISLIIYFFLKYLNILPGQVAAHFLPENWSYLNHLLMLLWDYVLLISLFVLPVTLSLVVKNLNWFKKYSLWILIIIFIFLAYITGQENNIFPHLGNMINQFGLGPNTTVMQGSILIWGSRTIYLTVHYLLSIAAAVNIFVLIQYRQKRESNNNLGFIWLFVLAYLLIILFIQSFDRYLLLILPFILFLFAKIITNYQWSKSVFTIVLMLIASYSIVGTYNYLAWNQSRWQLIDDFYKSNQVEVGEIEGGYEWNGWHLYQLTRQQPLGDFTAEWSPWYVKDLFPGHTMKYIISFSPIGGYKVIDQKEVDGIFSNIKHLYVNEVVPHSLE